MTPTTTALILALVSLGFLIAYPDDGVRMLTCQLWTAVVVVCWAIERKQQESK